MNVRDRIKELRRVRASELKLHPRNWRTHPPAQHDALRGILAEVGYADALLARETEDGSLELIDGHLRAETTPDMDVPVLVLDVSSAEAEKLLAVHDPLASLAKADDALLAALVEEIETESEALRTLLDGLAQQVSGEHAAVGETPPEVEIPSSHQVVVECRDEADQRRVYDMLTAEGYRCRVLSL